MDRRILEAKELIEELGYTFVSYSQSRGGHAKIVISDGVVTRFCFFPTSASDFRWKRNQRSSIRKLFRDYYTNKTQSASHQS